MKIISRDTLALGGFAGIREHRLVTDSRIFAERKKPEASEGLGSMVYLADAQYNPKGESGMHPHSEIDVISVIIEGRVSHKGSMEHGKNLVAGDVQVQRAGGEGFDHNEINPDNSKNRMLQVWALPETKGQPASYKFYTPKLGGVTRIYGGDKTQTETFDSHTMIDIIHLKAGNSMALADEQLSYVITGQATFYEPKDSNDNSVHQAQEGNLIRSMDAKVTATHDLHMLVVSQQA
ncbi:pirin family protein [Thalassomonas actiniarum]|uniref:Pirin family protein n=1 Tax=Thalassomonas actiniarum TaxID=485447 RepID=A0AAE9YPQ4_9GAMM|nr:pirin family protein [Thalassomonas actiniarum]WDD98760.1 pirin family protein [Thalassomonas actiniarum]